MRSAWLAIGATALAFGCTTAPQKPAPPPPVAAEAPAATTPAQTQKPSAEQDQCGSAALKYLIGQPKTAIPVPTDPSKRRVLCTSCPATLDYRPDRLNILFDAETGIVKEVKCG